MTPERFKDIAPYNTSEFKDKISHLITEPGFKHAVGYVLPNEAIPLVTNAMLSVNNSDEFQVKVMAPFLEMLATKTSAGMSADGFENCPPDVPYTYMSNHRDIVLDAAFLDVSLIRRGYPTCEIALGDNLLIYPWIESLVKLNKGFIVKRNLKLKQAFEASKQLSEYIRYCIVDKNTSIWIAQREGRAKDSSDRTQESVIKMLALSGGKKILETIKCLNICPVSISYELDPNDFLKAQEFLMKKRDPEYHKSQHDDLLSMETGLLGYKGRIHLHLSGSINPELDKLNEISDKNELVSKICDIIDNRIHAGYKIYPVNYICYDRVNHTDKYLNEYTEDDVEAFDKYLDEQLRKVRVSDVTEEEKAFMRNKMMEMYANPLHNKLISEESH